MRTFFGLVGLGMFLGFGVHEAVLREDPGAGAWLELTYRPPSPIGRGRGEGRIS